MLPRRCYFPSSLAEEKNRATVTAAATDREAAPGSALDLPQLYPEVALALPWLCLVLRKSREACGKVSIIQAEPQPDAWSPRMSSAGCRMTRCIPGTEGACSFVMDFRENCLCVWSRSAKSAGRTAFLSKWHLKGLNYFSRVETFI